MSHKLLTSKSCSVWQGGCHSCISGHPSRHLSLGRYVRMIHQQFWSGRELVCLLETRTRLVASITCAGGCQFNGKQQSTPVWNLRRAASIDQGEWSSPSPTKTPAVHLYRRQKRWWGTNVTILTRATVYSMVHEWPFVHLGGWSNGV